MIDACCLIDLLASGQAEAILRATGYAWHLPDAVQAEVQYVRQHDPAQPGAFITVPVDLSPHLASGLLTPCQPDDPQEQARFVHYATIFLPNSGFPIKYGTSAGQLGAASLPSQARGAIGVILSNRFLAAQFT